MILINGQPENRIEVADRGLQYGDGLFETIAYRNGQLEYFPQHISRLLEGCKRLKIAFPDSQQQALTEEVDAVCRQLNHDAVVKIIVTRGSGGRGYRYQTDMQTTRIISTHNMPAYPDTYQTGITVQICQQRLAFNPALAGIKHLNRLEQILARNEWQDDSIAEGLMFDYQDRLIEATMSNVFLMQNDQLWTAELAGAGVAGIMRQQVLEIADRLNITVNITSLDMNQLQQAEEIFVCNSLIGIWPVVHITHINKHLAHGPLTKKLQNALNSLNINE